MPVIVGGERTFLGSPRKVPKEGDIGEALSVALPRAKAALSYVPLPARISFSVYLVNSCAAGKKCSDFLPAG